MKRALLFGALVPLSLLATMDVSLKFAIDDGEAAGTFTVDDSAYFRYKLTQSALDAWKGNVRCFIKCNDISKRHTISTSSSFMELVQNVFSSNAIEVIGTVIAEAGQPVITLTKVMQGGKVIDKAKTKKSTWGTAVRFYLSDDMYVEITAQRPAEMTVKRSGLLLSDDEFKEIKQKKVAEELEIKEEDELPSVRKIVCVDDDMMPIFCDKCSAMHEATQGIHFHVITT